MTPSRWRRVVILGGSGFCGAHLAEHLAAKSLADEILLVDLVPPSPPRATRRFGNFLGAGRIKYLRGDVRSALTVPAGPIDLLVNFAAVHREPGHRDAEYWATNVPGAANACALADRFECRTILFASSIAIYGPGASPKDERSAPAPVTAYGASKLEAERIHREWHAADPVQRRLAIVRPGVVFGPGEEGNVSRLIRGVLHHRFAYVGSRRVRKAGLYVGEFVRASLWALSRASHDVVLADLTMHPAPSVEEYVAAVCAAAEVRRRVPTLPLPAAVALGALVSGAAALAGRSSDWHPARIAKLARANHIVPQTLLDGGYEFSYTLESAMREWKLLRPGDWS